MSSRCTATQDVHRNSFRCIFMWAECCAVWLGVQLIPVFHVASLKYDFVPFRGVWSTLWAINELALIYSSAFCRIALRLNTTHCGSAERIKRPSDFIHSDRRRLKAEELNESKREKANELKQHNHLRFKTVKVSGVPLDKRNFLSSLCVPVPDSQVDELYPGGARARDCRTRSYF